MKNIFTLLTTFCLVFTALNAQEAPDFTFTDTHGDEHNLAAAHEQGYIVVLDFFFVDCPPCQATAPELAAISNDYEGQNVIIWSMSDRDSDDAINGFEEQFGFNFPAGGPAGGGDDVISLYAANFNFTGFPTFSVACPNGDFTWDIWPISNGAAEIRNVIDACGVTEAAPYQPVNAVNVEEIAVINDAKLLPNPATTKSNLQLELAEATALQVQLVNVQGAILRTIFDGQMPAGATNLDVDVTDLPVGAYFVRLQHENGQTTTLPLQKG